MPPFLFALSSSMGAHPAIPSVYDFIYIKSESHEARVHIDDRNVRSNGCRFVKRCNALTQPAFYCESSII